MAKRTGIIEGKDGRPIIVNESKNKGSLDMEGTTRRRFGLVDSIKTFKAGR